MRFEVAKGVFDGLFGFVPKVEEVSLYIFLKLDKIPFFGFVNEFGFKFFNCKLDTFWKNASSFVDFEIGFFSGFVMN